MSGPTNPSDAELGNTGMQSPMEKEKEDLELPAPKELDHDSMDSVRPAMQQTDFLSRMRLQQPIPQFTHPRSDSKTDAANIVDFDGPKDPYKPMNWSNRKKMMTTLLYALTTAFSAFNSAIFATADNQLAEHLNQSTIVISLATSMTLLGFAFGPLAWGPLSEIYGRKWVVLGPYFIAACFAFACGASHTIESILITRFFQGLFSGSVLTNTGGVLGDMYPPKERGNALIIYSIAVVGGPLLSPIIGSSVVNSYLQWRWIMWLVGIMQMTCAAVVLVLVDETYAPILLARKAAKLRFATGNWALHAKHEEWDITFTEMCRKYFVRPFQLLVNPICFFMSLYAAFAYGLIYGSLSAIPIIFTTERHWGPITASLPFIALLLGCILGLFANTFNQKNYGRAVAKNGGKAVPEARLPPMMPGGLSMSIGLFIFAWTSTYDVVWVVPCIGLVLIGGGFFPIFQASLNYIIDTFLPVAASAVATVIFMRCVIAAAFPIFMGPMLAGIGVPWGVSLIGFISVAMLPMPFIMFKYGKKIREMRSISSVGM